MSHCLRPIPVRRLVLSSSSISAIIPTFPTSFSDPPSKTTQSIKLLTTLWGQNPLVTPSQATLTAMISLYHWSTDILWTIEGLRHFNHDIKFTIIPQYVRIGWIYLTTKLQYDMMEATTNTKCSAAKLLDIAWSTNTKPIDLRSANYVRWNKWGNLTEERSIWPNSREGVSRMLLGHRWRHLF